MCHKVFGTEYITPSRVWDEIETEYIKLYSFKKYIRDGICDGTQSLKNIFTDLTHTQTLIRPLNNECKSHPSFLYMPLALMDPQKTNITHSPSLMIMQQLLTLSHESLTHRSPPLSSPINSHDQISPIIFFGIPSLLNLKSTISTFKVCHIIILLFPSQSYFLTPCMLLLSHFLAFSPLPPLLPLTFSFSFYFSFPSPTRLLFFPNVADDRDS